MVRLIRPHCSNLSLHSKPTKPICSWIMGRQRCFPWFSIMRMGWWNWLAAITYFDPEMRILHQAGRCYTQIQRRDS